MRAVASSHGARQTVEKIERNRAQDVDRIAIGRRLQFDQAFLQRLVDAFDQRVEKTRFVVEMPINCAARHTGCRRDLGK